MHKVLYIVPKERLNLSENLFFFFFLKEFEILNVTILLKRVTSDKKNLENNMIMPSSNNYTSLMSNLIWVKFMSIQKL